ncbi:SH3 domain-containing protein [Fortiea contorta]|uniref:SH3 domain-containing protein n=1 Tax=Fortiea contorta TaxID=1892405 RepID=UPI000347FF86|nr:SH3 domain-containing protein [Fortiea contorta]
MQNPTSKLITGLVITCTSVLCNTGIADQIVLAKSKNPQKCDILAYVTDQDPQGVNVRSGASSKNKIIGTIPVNETVNAIASADTWVKVTNASGGFQGTGWVSSSMLGIASRGYDTNGVNLYSNPNQKSRKVGQIPPIVNVKLLSCKGDWAQVEYKGIKGWLAREDQCGAALTTCS